VFNEEKEDKEEEESTWKQRAIKKSESQKTPRLSTYRKLRQEDCRRSQHLGRYRVQQHSQLLFPHLLAH
jgi:hypothetical protein